MRHTVGLDHDECGDERGRCKRNVDQEHRFPTEGAREHTTEQDADHEASRACAAPDPQCAVSITTFCEGGLDNRQGAREDTGPAQTLNRARRELDFAPRSKATGKRAKGVPCQARDKSATSSEQIACATAEPQEAARCHRICADDGLQRVSRVAQVATDLRKCHDDDVLVERNEEHRERKQCQDRRVPFPANVVFNNSASPWGTIDTHGTAPSSPCAADESNSGRLASLRQLFFYRREIRSKPDVPQLIRIADQVDCDDTTGTVFDGHRIDRTIAFAQNEAREPVHRGGPRRHGRERRVFAGNAGKETQNSVNAADRVERCSAFAAAVRIQHGIFSQNLGKGLRIARCHCRMKRASKPTAVFARGRKAWPASFDMNSGARRELTAGGFAAVECACYFDEVETETSCKRKLARSSGESLSSNS